MDKLEITPIEVQKPTDIIVSQIKDLISSGALKPGDKLPPERQLAENFNIGRGYVREAIKKLEFYGILKTFPQSGTSVANLGVSLLDGLIANVLQLEKNDFQGLIETRSIIESGAAKLAAERADTIQIAELESILNSYKEKASEGEAALDEDMLFHLKIAELSANRVLQSLISLIAPEVHHLSNELNTCSPERLNLTIEEHKAIFIAIKSKQGLKAFEAMKVHMANSN